MRFREILNPVVENARGAGKVSLPGPGETPFWIAPLAKYTAELQRDWGNHWTWATGGCFAFAEVFQKVFGGELWGVCSDPDGGEDYAVEHAMVKLNGHFYDFSGVVDVNTYMQKLHAQNGRDLVLLPQTDERVFWFEDDYIDDDGMKLLRDVLRGRRPVVENAGAGKVEVTGSGDLFVATIDGKFAGKLTLSTKIGLVGEGERCVDWVEVDRRFRRQGVATALYDAAERYLAKRGERLVPSPNLSDGATAFWKARRPVVENAPGAVGQDVLKTLAKKLKADGFTQVKIMGEQWLVHFSGDAGDICRQGFTKGTPLNHEGGWKGTWGRRFDQPGFNFAVEAGDEHSLEFWSLQSPDAVVFRAAGVRCWHKDGFDQVIFDGQSVRSPIYHIGWADEDGSYLSVIDEADFAVVAKDGRPLADPLVGDIFVVLDAIKRGQV